ncbi:MAG TPA: nuclear transport factor 2 family protein [Sorangium sp.]|nr:nuclear transport factor 2 family protein [Sorangium sp.]
MRRIYDLFSAGDRDGMRALLAEDFEWDYFGPKSIPWAGKYRGAAGFDRFFENVAGVIEPIHFEPREFIDAGDKIVVTGISCARAVASGVSYEAQWVNVFWIEGGRVKRLLDLYETASVLRALEAAPRS